MLKQISFDPQGLLLHRVVFIILVAPFQRLFLKLMGVESMALGLLILSLILLVILQIKPIQAYFKGSITGIFSTTIFQKYLFYFLCLEDYVSSPKGRWSITTISFLFIFSLYAQFVFQDSIQLFIYTFIYTVFLIYLSLRNSKLFSSTPVSWEKNVANVGVQSRNAKTNT